MTRLLLLPAAILALAAAGAQAITPEAVDPKLASLQQQCELESQDTNRGSVPQSCLDFETARAKQPAAAAPSLEECAHQTLHSQNGISQACSELLDKANKSGEMAKRGGLTAVAKAYKGRPDAVQGDQPAAAAALVPKTAPVDEEFKGLPDAQARELSALKKQCAGTTLGFWNAGDYALGGPCKELAGKRDAAMRQLDKACEAYKDLDVGQMDNAQARDTKEACVNRRDQQMGIDRRKLKTPEQCKVALEAQQERDPAQAKTVKARLSALCGPVFADMMQAIKEKRDTGTPAGVLTWVQGQCPNADLKEVCLALGHDIGAAALGQDVKLSGERKALEGACAGGSDQGACEKLSHLVVKDELGKQCSGGDESACERLSHVVTQEELDKRPEVKHQIARAHAYNANTEQAARYDKYIQKHFKDPKQQDLMERLMRANPETMGKLMEQNTQCESTKNAAACDRKFYSNYLGLANGHPVSDVGRRYLANMCAMPENKDVDACKHKETYAIAKRKHEAPPDPAARSAPSSGRPQSFFTSLFGGSSTSRGHYIKGTNLPCNNVINRDTDCEWR